MSRNTTTHPVTGAQIVYFSSTEEYRHLLDNLQEAGSPILNSVGLGYDGAAMASIANFLDRTVLRNGDTPNTSLSERQIYEGAKGTYRGYTNGIYTGKGEASKLYLNLTTEDDEKFFGPSVNYKDQRNGDGDRLYPGLTRLIFAISEMSDAEKRQANPPLLDRVSAKFERGELSVPGYPSNEKTVQNLINDTLKFSMLKKINEQGREVSLEAADIEFFAYRNKNNGKVSIGVSPRANIPLSLDSVQKIEEYVSQPLNERRQKHIENFAPKSHFKNAEVKRLGTEHANNTLKTEKAPGIIDNEVWGTAFFLEKGRIGELADHGNLTTIAQNVCRANDYIHGKYSEFHKNGINNIWQGYAQLIASGTIYASDLSFPRGRDAASICSDIDNINQIKSGADRKQAFLDYMSGSKYPVFCAYYQHNKDGTGLSRDTFLAIQNKHPADTLIVPYAAMGDDGKSYYALQKIVPLSNDNEGFNNTKLTMKGNSFLGHHLVVRDYDSVGATACDRPTIILSEGISTAIAINSALDDNSATQNGLMVVSCASSSNMNKAFERLANIYPNANFIVAADNDFGLTTRAVKRFLDNEFSGVDIDKSGHLPIRQLKSPKDATFAKALKDTLESNTGIKYAERLLNEADGILGEKTKLAGCDKGRVGLMVPDATLPISQINADTKGEVSLPFATQQALMQGLKSGTVSLSVLQGVTQSAFANSDFDDALKVGLKKALVRIDNEQRYTEEGREAARLGAWNDYTKNITAQINQVAGLDVAPAKAEKNVLTTGPVAYKRSSEIIQQIQAVRRAKIQKNRSQEADTEAGMERLKGNLQQVFGDNKELYHRTMLAIHGMGINEQHKQVVGIKEDHLNKVVIANLLTASSPDTEAEKKDRAVFKPLMEEIFKDSQRNSHLLAQDTFEAQQWANLAKGFAFSETLRDETKSQCVFLAATALSPMFFGSPKVEPINQKSLNEAKKLATMPQEATQAIVVASVVQGLLRANRETSGEAVDTPTAVKMTGNLKDAIIKEGETPPLVKSVLDTMHEMAKAGVYSSPEASDSFYKHLGQNDFCPSVAGKQPESTLITSLASQGYTVSDSCTDRLLNDTYDGISHAQDYKVGMNTPVVIRGYSDMYSIDGRLIRAQDALSEINKRTETLIKTYDKFTAQAPNIGAHKDSFIDLLKNHSFAGQERTLLGREPNSREHHGTQHIKEGVVPQNDAPEP